MKWHIEWVKSHIEDKRFMGSEIVEAEWYGICDTVGVFKDSVGLILHSVPADKVIVIQIK